MSKHLICAAVIGILLAATDTGATTEKSADVTPSVVSTNANPNGVGLKIDRRAAAAKRGGDKLLDDKMILSGSNGFYLLHGQIGPRRQHLGTETNWQPCLHLVLRTSDGPMNSSGAQGYHGHMYMTKDRRNLGSAQICRVDMWTSADRTRIVVMIADNGPIYSSTNSGMSWAAFNTPGEYEFTLTGGPNEGGFDAAGTIRPSPENQPASVPSISNWYVVTSGRNGKELVMTEDASQPSPVLSIAHLENGIVISWSGAFTNFVLQANSDLNTTNWLDVTNTVNIVINENQVIAPPEFENHFFRLRSK